MNKLICWLAVILALPSLCLGDLGKAFQRQSVLLPSSITKTGQVAALVDDILILAGGVDANGKAVKEVFALRNSELEGYALADQTNLSSAPGLAVGAAFKEGLVLAAALERSTSTLYRVLYTKEGFTTNSLQPLPEPTKVLGMDFIGNLLCVFGFDQQSANNVLFTLEMGVPGAKWSVDRGFPGPALETAVVRANYDMLHIFGGKTHTDGSATASSHGWRQKPLDGLEQSGWIPLAPLPFPVAAGTAFVTGQAHIGLIPAAKANAPAESPLLIFHSITDTWVSAGTMDWQGGSLSPVRMDDTIVFAGAGTHSLPMLKLESSVGNLRLADYIVMLLYFLVLAGIGLYFARKQKSSASFSIGGGKVAWWAAAISMFATGASAISFMAIPSQVFRTSLVWLLPVVVFIPLYFAQAYLIYPLLRRLNIVSTYEYLQRRFHFSLRLLASLQCIAFQTFGRISVVILLPALAISAATGVDVATSVLLMGLVTTLYTTFGGYEAVVWTDVLQGLLMIAGIGLMIGFALSGMPGGLSEFIEIGDRYGKFDLYISGWDISMALGSFLIIRQLAEQFAQTADQPIIQRVFSTPLPHVRKLAAMFAFFSILIMVLVQVMGLSMFGFFHGNPEKLDPMMSNDQIVPLFVTQTLPAGMSGLIIAALFAASMSSLSSSINSVSTLIAEDFYAKFVPGVSDRKKLFLMKAASLFIGLFGTITALVMARLDIRSIFQVWFEITALIGGGFVGMYFLGMLTRRANSLGVAIGALSSIVCLFLVKHYTQIHWSLYQVTAIGSCVVIGYISSLIIPSKAKDLTGLTIFTPTKDRDPR